MTVYCAEYIRQGSPKLFLDESAEVHRPILQFEFSVAYFKF
jgi:hypothetical protein